MARLQPDWHNELIRPALEELALDLPIIEFSLGPFPPTSAISITDLRLLASNFMRDHIPQLKPSVLDHIPLISEHLKNVAATVRIISPVKLELEHAQPILRAALQGSDPENYYCQAKAKWIEYFGDVEEPVLEVGNISIKDTLENQCLLLKKLEDQERELDKKLGSVKAWRKVCKATYRGVYVSILLSSVVLTADDASPIAKAIALPAATAMKWMEDIVDSHWDKREDKLEGEIQVIKAMRAGMLAAINGLVSIWEFVQKLNYTDEAKEEKIKGKVEELMKGTAVLEKKLDYFVNVIERELMEFLKVISK